MNKSIGQLSPLFKKLTVLLLLLSIHSLAKANDLVKVEGTYVYYAPGNCSVEQAKQTALDRAKIQALADAFGTIVSQTNSTRISNQNGNTDTDFLSIGSSDVKGEWIETTGNPEYQIEYKDNMLVVRVKVKGKARELTTQKVDISVHLLKNGTEDKFEGNTYKTGDEMFLSFQTPTDGYIAVYLVDEQPKAYCLLPYRGQTNGIYKVSANKRYVFFSKKMSDVNERHIVDEYILTCSGESEHNQVYVVFSPEPFSKANDNSMSSALPRELDYDDFIRWLSKVKRLDTKLNSVMIPITLTK
ncbi:MAG: DUF4384 domain-containing protein [Prevotella sp.]|nr:DUF4384 domain-containing protein [Prevotella sp.]